MAGRDREERGGYISFADMFDGGGPGRRGATFEGGGILSDFANMGGSPRKSRGAETGQIRPLLRPSKAKIDAARARVNAPYSLGRDLFDGGGLGRRATLAEINAGRGFRGGFPSMLANMFGVRPMGSNDLSLIASYDAALASRPDIAGQMQRGLLDPVADEQSQYDLSKLGYPQHASGAAYDDMRLAEEVPAAEVPYADAPNFPFDPMLASDPEVAADNKAAALDGAINSGFNVTVPILEGLLAASTDGREVGTRPAPPMTSNRTIDRNPAQEDRNPAQEFSAQLESRVGLSKAVEIMSGKYGSQAYSEFTANGNQLPSQFSQRELNLGVYGDPFGYGVMGKR